MYMSAFETQILCSVDYDCDGPLTYFYRVEVPRGLSDKDAAAYAMEQGQMTSGDPSEWFTIPREDYLLCVPAMRERFGAIGDPGKVNPNWASMQGVPYP